jgi:deazaflavin-dependent oxidoreductase (nitroreductase family)
VNPIGKLFIAGHVFVYRASRGKMGSSMGGGNVLLLSTKGAKTGKVRTVPVMYFEDGGQPFVIASAGGSPSDPAWFKNLKRDPAVRVEVGAEKYDARAEVLAGEDRARAWRTAVLRMPRFADYEGKVKKSREIPIVALRRT